MAKEKNTRIVVFGDFEILVDSTNYALVRNTRKKNKDGEIIYKYISYHGSLEDALIACKKQYHRKELLDCDILDIDDAVAILIRTNRRFEELVKNSFERAKV